MATITSAQSGDFSDTATWVGGVVPTVGDIAIAATGHIISIDTDVTLTQVQQVGTGKFTLGNGRTLTANVQANQGTLATGGTVEIISTTTAAIIGNILGVSSTTANQAAVVINSNANITIQGNITGTTGGSTKAVLYVNSQCTLSIVGNLTGGSGAGGGVGSRCMWITTSSTNSNITIQGNVNAGSADSGHGLISQGTSTIITIVGNVTGSTGAFGSARGVYIIGTGEVVQITGIVIGGARDSLNIGCQLTGTNNQVTINGDVFGGTGGTSYGAFSDGSTNNIIIVGNLTGGSGGSSHALLVTGNSNTVTITGNITGGSGTSVYGISSTNSATTINVVGNVSGGGGPGTAAHGIYATGASSIIDVTGTLTGTNNSSAGVRSDATTGYVIFGGNLIDSPAGATALYAIRARIRSTGVSGYNQYSTTDGFTTGSQVQRVSADIVTGMPANRDVRLSTLYGYNNELTGTMIVPPTSSVLTGVLVDNSTGSLVFDSKEQIADAVLHLLAGITETGSVVTIPFYSGSKDYSRTTIVDGTRTKTFTPIEE
jgi:hypothetical protein